MQEHLNTSPSERGYYAAEDTGEFLAENPHAIARDQPAYFVKLFPHLSFRCQACEYRGSRAHPQSDRPSAIDAERYHCPNTECKNRLQIQPMVDIPDPSSDKQLDVDDWATL